MKISITQSHIDKGEKFNYVFCPVALALKDAGLQNVACGTQAIAFMRNNKMERLILPEFVTKWIRSFDHDMKIEPFEFELSI